MDCVDCKLVIIKPLETTTISEMVAAEYHVIDCKECAQYADEFAEDLGQELGRKVIDAMCNFLTTDPEAPEYKWPSGAFGS